MQHQALKIEDAFINDQTVIVLIDGDNSNAFDEVKIPLSYLMDFIDEKGMREYSLENWDHKGHCTEETGTTPMDKYLLENIKEVSASYLQEEPSPLKKFHNSH